MHTIIRKQFIANDRFIVDERTLKTFFLCVSVPLWQERIQQ